jgi:hypothetical protein
LENKQSAISAREVIMARYKVVTATRAFSKPGSSPTTKQGNDVGGMPVDVTFSSTRNINGWLAVNDADNKWVRFSCCKEVEIPPEPPSETVVILQTRRGVKTGDNPPMFEPWEEWHQ